MSTRASAIWQSRLICAESQIGRDCGPSGRPEELRPSGGALRPSEGTADAVNARNSFERRRFSPHAASHPCGYVLCFTF